MLWLHESALRKRDGAQHLEERAEGETAVLRSQLSRWDGGVRRLRAALDDAEARAGRLRELLEEMARPHPDLGGLSLARVLSAAASGVPAAPAADPVHHEAGAEAPTDPARAT